MDEMEPTEKAPSDAGSSTFARYRYQAEVAFPFCLDCALGGEIQAVVPEHYEDIALQYPNRWRFLQVKTKGRGIEHWTLGDATAKKGGIDSLYRSFCSLPSTTIQMELIVEGGLRHGDDIECLQLGPDRDLDKVRLRVAKALEKQFADFDEAVCDAFLQCLSVKPNLYHRVVIGDANYRTLCNHAPALGVDEVSRIHQGFMAMIESAMAADLIPGWPRVLVDETPTAEAERRLRAKRLTAESFTSLVTPLTKSPQPLLKLAISPDAEQPGPMVQKLMLGGASDSIVNDAKRFRSEAALREFERLALSPQGDSALEDVKTRLLGLVNAVKTRHLGTPASANRIWGDLFDRVVDKPSAFDPRGFFGKDPYLLLGEICEMTDACMVEWS